MSETSETPTVRSSTATAPAPAEPVVVHRAPRVFQAAAWVAIVAGTVFVLAVIFFTGFLLGKSTGHHHGHHHHKHHAMVHPHRFGGPGGPGGWGATPPGPPPASVAPAAPGPGQIPSSVVPSRTP
ncbi:hypothetical protein [Mycobacterium sp. Aquia_216]|uniref:hypothetical protein n=1 Tax=Mycobacterium sp. Aquia_216 TaxID=2991729 RepID=UPI003FA3682D